MSTLRSICLLLLSAALPGLAAAQTEAEPELPPRYNVELVLFAHTDVDAGEELFDAEDEPASGSEAPPGPRPQDVVAIAPFDTRRSFGSAATEPPAGDAAGPGGATEADLSASDPLSFVDPFGTANPLGIGPAAVGRSIRRLDPEELELNDARDIIDRLGAYRLLGHGGWQQFGLEQDEAVPVDVARLGILNPSGTILLYLGRFLHLRVDLDYRDPATRLAGPTAGSAPAAAGGLAAPDTFGGLMAFSLPEHYRLRTERNAIRSGELHYIDHPRFGILVRVTPAPEEIESPAPGSGDEQPSA